MTARALPNGRTWMWSCPPCIDANSGGFEVFAA